MIIPIISASRCLPTSEPVPNLQSTLVNLNRIAYLTRKYEQECQRIDTEISQCEVEELPSREIRVFHKIKEGNFGKVYKARVVQTCKIYALKKVQINEELENREEEFCRKLRNNFIVKVFDVYTSGKELNILMELYEFDLKDYIDSVRVGELQRKIICYQMLRAVHYIHSRRVCHRDIKPENFFMNRNNRVVLGDFGSAKRVTENTPGVTYIGSRAYRAVELLLGEQTYDESVDIWSLGCVFAEIALRKELIEGESVLDCLLSITRIFGSKQIKGNFPRTKGRTLAKVMAPTNCESSFVNLLESMLRINPKDRISPIDGLLHPYFNEIRDDKVIREAMAQELRVDGLLDFTPGELRGYEHLKNKLIPLWKRKNFRVKKMHE